eukprot:TRINITY_DN6670_c0_g1_i1.p2 TRINITY_DN6670_c0_g1~~TRINITY_DN6670_c0_g1_i1.p2  ORF type:complete len:127 (+),score=2.99 TRINITY_DN6670_c0_g1_i1:818-1198(+)
MNSFNNIRRRILNTISNTIFQLQQLSEVLRNIKDSIATSKVQIVGNTTQVKKVVNNPKLGKIQMIWVKSSDNFNSQQNQILYYNYNSCMEFLGISKIQQRRVRCKLLEILHRLKKLSTTLNSEKYK